MLRLKNIRINGKVIEADYFPESGDRSAHVSLDPYTGEEIKEIIEEYGDTYARMAINGLCRILEERKQGKDIPSERVVMWY